VKCFVSIHQSIVSIDLHTRPQSRYRLLTPYIQAREVSRASRQIFWQVSQICYTLIALIKMGNDRKFSNHPELVLFIPNYTLQALHSSSNQAKTPLNSLLALSNAEIPNTQKTTPSCHLNFQATSPTPAPAAQALSTYSFHKMLCVPSSHNPAAYNNISTALINARRHGVLDCLFS
jgi:hypothetical protein